MRRLLRIARREYLAYIRTPGFWLSLLLLPVGLSMIVIAPMAVDHATPIPRIAIVDLTGQHLEGPVAYALAPPGAPPAAIVVPAPGGPFASSAAARAHLEPLLRSAAPENVRLDAAAIIRPQGASVTVDFWTRNVVAGGLEQTVSGAIADAVKNARLKAMGVDPKTLDAMSPTVSLYSPKAAAGKVELKDRLPAVAGLAMGMLLLMVVLTGAGMLLNSVMEEKTSRIIEVLLSSASVPEIMGGKILGVAAVTGTILFFWMSIAGGLVAVRSPQTLADLAGVFLQHGHWAYFILYFTGGYLMFATLYVTVGAFCETSREAQTLLGPMMIVMTVPAMFMIQGASHPDSPLLRTLAWVPLFTPFMMAARAATDPPLWEIAGTAAVMFGVTGLELWLAVPAFKAGALATGRFDVRLFFASLGRRQKG
ncbi:MAG: ABC transporter permease [Caulobacteraceae bacterium]|jgi:ABC-2 type transport system permease protein